MKRFISIFVAILCFSLLTLSAETQAGTSAHDLLKEGDEFIYPKSEPLKARECFMAASKAATTGPGKGFCLFKYLCTWDGVHEDFDRNRSMIFSYYDQADKLLMQGSDELKKMMMDDSTFPRELGSNDDCAKTVREWLQDWKKQVGPRRVQRLLNEAYRAVEEERYDVVVPLYLSAIAMSRDEYNDFPSIIPGGCLADHEFVRVPESLQDKGRYKDANTLLEALYARDQRLNKLGVLKDKDYVRAMAADHFELGQCLFHLKDFKNAEVHFKKALALREQLYGADHACPARVIAHLAQVYNATDRKADALQAQKYVDKFLPFCPTCASNSNVLPYCYGLPHGVKLTHYGQEFAIGGCMYSASKSPNWLCDTCKKGFRSAKMTPARGQAGAAAHSSP